MPGSQDVPLENVRNLKGMFRALSARNYRLFFIGQGVSLVGTWMQRLAIGWLVYRLTSSEFQLGVVSFLGLFPVFILSPLAGVLADRFNRLQLLIFTQVMAMLQASILAILVMSGRIGIEQIMLLAFFLGVINAFDTPIRQAFIVEMIEKKEDLSNAIALNSAMFNAARLIGPTLAGILIAALGEGLCFLFNALSYLAVIFALLLMKITTAARTSKKQNIFSGLREGFSYSFGFPPIRYIILLLLVASLGGTPYLVLMPVFAKDVLHGGAHTLGFLMGAAGGGALIGAIYLASRQTVAGLERVIPLMAGLFGLALVAFSFSRHLGFSICLLTLAGFGMMVQMASSNTILQTISDEDKRGRVMSLYVMCFMGTSPFGGLLAGALAHEIGAPETIFLGGLACLAAALLFALKLPVIKTMAQSAYRQKGFV